MADAHSKIHLSAWPSGGFFDFRLLLLLYERLLLAPACRLPLLLLELPSRLSVVLLFLFCLWLVFLPWLSALVSERRSAAAVLEAAVLAAVLQAAAVAVLQAAVVADLHVAFPSVMQSRQHSPRRSRH